MFGKILNSVVNTTESLVRDPIGTTINTAIQPVVDTLDVIDGVLEGELREKAALRLGADVVAGMALAEVVEYLNNG